MTLQPFAIVRWPLQPHGIDELNDSLVASIHDMAGKLSIACTGGGSSAISRLLAVPGASRTLLEAVVPYHETSLADYVGGAPDQSCSGKTARAMAMAALRRAMSLDSQSAPLFGVGCTAALVTDRDRRGTDRCYIAIQSVDLTIEYSITLSRSGRDRTGQEALCGDLVLWAIARSLGIPADRPGLLPDESLLEDKASAEPAWRLLFTGDARLTGDIGDPPLLVFPGAFNPVHTGHREMARIAAGLTGIPVLFEVSAFNVDKPPLDYIEMRTRQQGLTGLPFVFSNAPTFVEKSALFPGSTFIVGSDTLERIASPRYYHQSRDLRDRALAGIADNGSTFLVFGRVSPEGFRGLDEIEIPDSLRAISRGVSEEEFREDVSSTQIRRQSPQSK